MTARPCVQGASGTGREETGTCDHSGWASWCWPCWSRACASSDPRRAAAGCRRAGKAQAEPPPERQGELVKGYGVDPARAEEQAVEQAQERVRDLLAEKLGTSLRPDSDMLDPDYLTPARGHPARGRPVAVTLKDGDWFVASYRVRLNDNYLREVARFARHQQMGDRHLIAARVLAGLVALLLVVTGYLRLEEATRGYATTMLRAAAVAVLLVVVVLGLMVTA